MKKARVAFLERMIPDYRVEFFELLHEELKKEQIELMVVTGKSNPKEHWLEKSPDVDWVKKVWSVYILSKFELYFVPKKAITADLVILHLYNSSLFNYPLLLRRLVTRRPKIAFFCHGKNLNLEYSARTPIRERFKWFVAKQADWWFPYTELSKRIISSKEIGFRADRMTVVNNSIDTRLLRSQLEDMKTKNNNLREEMGFKKNAKIGLFCGRLMRIKLAVLEDAALLIKEQVSEFCLIIIGQGDEEKIIKEYASMHEWVHYVGPKYGTEKLPYFAIADLFLMPGLIGLAVLDAFAAGLPVITTDCKIHSPEIEYLKAGVNGVVTPLSAIDYARAVITLLRNEEKRKALSVQAAYTAESITVENMVHNFVVGIKNVLALTVIPSENKVAQK